MRNKIIYLILLFPLLAMAQDTNSLQAVLTKSGESINLRGESSFINYPSLYSVYLNTEAGRCGLHLMGFSAQKESESVYKIPKEDGRSARMVCVFESDSPKERFLSDEGEILVSYSNSKNILKGSFNVTLAGGITGKKYTFAGEFNASQME